MDDPGREPDDSEGLYRVAPRDPDIVDYEPQILRIEIKLPEDEEFEEEPETAPWQFTLDDLFLLTTVTAVFLGIMSCLPWPLAAGLIGAGVLVGLMVLNRVPPSRRRAHVVWWAMLLVYLFISLAAMCARG